LYPRNPLHDRASVFVSPKTKSIMLHPISTVGRNKGRAGG
jgi:hypothetical protein